MDGDVLKKISFFDTLTADELNEVLALTKQEDFKGGDKIFSEGDKGDKLYIIIAGAIRISKSIPGMGEEALSILRTGDYFGEMALIEDITRTADATAHEGSSLISISKEDLQSLMEKNREMGYKILTKFVGTLSRRLRETNDKLRSFFAMSGGF
ncbi:MAG: cyclic nucleotide-binding domain-containing protein [Deltaproteobacteria bacterium]|nr:cyclic nucleotide-binding domain-containing protein [Deltaproteobacteria bacterium]